MKRSLLVAFVVLVLWFGYGVARGGNARAAGWQVYLLFACILASFAIASAFKTADHYIMLANVALAAGIYRAIMCIVFYLEYVRPGGLLPRPEYMTSHDDSVLWTVGIAFVLLGAVVTPSLRTRVTAGLVTPLLLCAMQFNNRRLAWISLGGAIIALYFLLPASPAKRRARRIAWVIVPVLGLYTAIGWGRPEGIFRPLRSFETVSVEQDASTLARNAENLGLIATANQGWVLGTGWGQKYVEVTNKYQIHFFELWPYIPHNSVLGLFAYTGYFGFVGFWMIFPTATFLHARTATFAPKPRDRLVGMLGVVQILACANQWYGDMGSFSATTMYMLAASFAAALRIPIATGAWPGGEPSAKSPALGGPSS
jgi:O-Antigen ligase